MSLLLDTSVIVASLDSERRGARGGAIYDLLHLAAARKAGVETLVTLDVRDFQALLRPGDPTVKAP